VGRVDEGASAKTAGLVAAEKTPPPQTGGVRVDREEMIRILEEIIRDPDTNATARCTAIRTLREIAPSHRQLARSPPWTSSDRGAVTG
jgi:hypothetical protein